MLGKGWPTPMLSQCGRHDLLDANSKAEQRPVRRRRFRGRTQSRALAFIGCPFGQIFAGRSIGAGYSPHHSTPGDHKAAGGDGAKGWGCDKNDAEAPSGLIAIQNEDGRPNPKVGRQAWGDRLAHHNANPSPGRGIFDSYPEHSAVTSTGIRQRRHITPGPPQRNKAGRKPFGMHPFALLQTTRHSPYL